MAQPNDAADPASLAQGEGQPLVPSEPVGALKDKKHVVIIGGSFAGRAITQGLQKLAKTSKERVNVEITIIDKAPHFEYNLTSYKALYYPDEEDKKKQKEQEKKDDKDGAGGGDGEPETDVDDPFIQLTAPFECKQVVEEVVAEDVGAAAEGDAAKKDKDEAGAEGDGDAKEDNEGGAEEQQLQFEGGASAPRAKGDAGETVQRVWSVMDSYHNDPALNKVIQVKFIQGTLRKVEEKAVVIAPASPEEGAKAEAYNVEYDVLVLATGAAYTAPKDGAFWREGADKGRTRRERSEEFAHWRGKLKAAKKVVVAGGGPVGLQTAGWIKEMYPDSSVEIATKGKELLGHINSKYVNK